MKMTLDLVKEALTKTLKLPDSHTIQNNDLLKETLGLDSMSSLIFLMNLEETISGFVVDPDSLQTEDLVTVESITQYVDQQLAMK